MSETYNGETIDSLLHDADRAFGGIGLAVRMGDSGAANRLRIKAVRLYAEALFRDPDMRDGAWAEDGNRDEGWLRRVGFTQMADAMLAARKAGGR